MSIKILKSNRKAFHDFEVLETFEAGIILKGTEVKSIRNGVINFKDSYVSIQNNEVFLLNCHVARYTNVHISMNHDEEAQRKLLLNKKEIERLKIKADERGFSIIPLKVYLKNSRIKIEIGICKGRRNFDKRNKLKEQTIKREMERCPL